MDRVERRRERRKAALAAALDARRDAPRPTAAKQTGLTTYLTGSFGYGVDYPSSSAAGLVHHAYTRNEIAFSGIRELADAVASLPLVVLNEQTGETTEDHPALRAWQNGAPSLEMPPSLVMKTWVTWLYTGGNGVLQKVRGGNGLTPAPVVELWPLMLPRLSIVPGERRLIDEWRYQVGARTFAIPPENVTRVRFPSLTDDVWGMSPLHPAFRRIVGDNKATDLIHEWMDNRAVPSLVVTGATKPNKSDEERHRAQMREKVKHGDVMFVGGSNAMGGTVDVKSIAWDMQQLGMPEVFAQSETRILAVLGVPPILVGVKAGLDRSTYANYGMAVRSFWQETVRALLTALESVINADPDFDVGRGRRIVFDTSGVPAMEAVRDERRANARKDYLAGVISLTEAREEGGFGAPSPELVAREETRDGNSAAAARALSSSPVTRKSASDVASVGAAVGTSALAVAANPRLRKASREWYRRIENDSVKALREAERLVGKAASRKQIDEAEAAAIAAAVAAALSLAAEDWQRLAVENLVPIIRALAVGSAEATAVNFGIDFEIDATPTEEFLSAYELKFSREITDTARERVRTILRDGLESGSSVNDIARQFREEFSDWSAASAERVARTEVIRASNKGAKAAYVQGGVTEIEWMTTTNPCEFCAALNGLVVGVQQNFVSVGATVEGVDGGTFTNTFVPVDVPPLHPHCDCTIAAVD